MTNGRELMLVAFIRARLAEDEAAAREALNTERSLPAPEFTVRYEWVRLVQHRNGAAGSTFHPGGPSPARALRQVAALRQIVDRHTHHGPDLWNGRYCVICGEADGGCPDLRALASMWADHPDFDPAWTPEEVR